MFHLFHQLERSSRRIRWSSGAFHFPSRLPVTHVGLVNLTFLSREPPIRQREVFTAAVTRKDFASLGRCNSTEMTRNSAAVVAALAFLTAVKGEIHIFLFDTVTGLQLCLHGPFMKLRCPGFVLLFVRVSVAWLDEDVEQCFCLFYCPSVWVRLICGIKQAWIWGCAAVLFCLLK